MITNVIIGDEHQINDEVTRVSQFPDDVHIVDLGGGMQRLARADYVVDLMSFDESRKYPSRGSPDKCSRGTWIVADLCDPMTYFSDREFDYAFCSQTIEDVRDPIALIREISRISLSGFISTIHWTYELNAEFVGFWHPDLRAKFVGYWHHRWVVGIKDGVLEFIYKPPFIHCDLEHKVPEAGQMLHIKWSDEIAAREIHYQGPARRQDFLGFLVDRWGNN